MRLTLFNRDEVMAFINRPVYFAHLPTDFGSDIIVVCLPGRRTGCVVLGEIVVRTDTEILVGSMHQIRDRWPINPTRPAGVVQVAKFKTDYCPLCLQPVAHHTINGCPPPL